MTQQIMMQVNRALLYFSVASNCVFAYLLFVQLQTTPQDVLLEVRQQTGQLQLQAEKAEAKIQVISQELAKRDEWMQSVNTELAQRTRDRVHRTEFVNWCAEAKALNPELNIPLLEECSNLTQEVIP